MLVVFLAYFGGVAMASSLNASWLPAWLSFSAPIAHALSALVPAFDIAEREITAAGAASRVPIVHHLMAVGWLLFIVSFTASITTIRKMTSLDKDWIARNWPSNKMIGPLFFLMFGSAVYWMLFRVGVVTPYTPLPAHRSDLGLLRLAAPFVVAQTAGATAALAIRLWMISGEINSLADDEQ